ncbi:hypothetical protein [Streptomyces sp. NPDC020298]|uniref:hypothetical protein n=1 Tax=unclassified Streptomyces TaxID=2593676 RepID=UPI0033F1B554
MTTAVVRDQLELQLFANLFDEPLYAPPPAAAAPVAVDTRAHVWIVAAEIKVEDRIAKATDFQGSFTASPGTRVDALEVYCRACRRPTKTWSATTACPHQQPAPHRRRPDGTRQEEGPRPPPHAKMIPGGTIQRRGISAYASGVSRPAR